MNNLLTSNKYADFWWAIFCAGCFTGTGALTFAADHGHTILTILSGICIIILFILSMREAGIDSQSKFSGQGW